MSFATFFLLFQRCVTEKLGKDVTVTEDNAVYFETNKSGACEGDIQKDLRDFIE